VIVFAVKLLLVPALIVLITFAGRRWGPAVAGWMSGFPVVAGPILLLVAVERGAGFAAHAALGTLSAVPAAVAFALGYAWATRRFGWPACLLAGVAAFFATVGLLYALAPSLPLAALFAFGAPFAAGRLFPRVGAGPYRTAGPGRPSPWRCCAASCSGCTPSRCSAWCCR
jgi:uncharacterized membrane protein (GlpM family)